MSIVHNGMAQIAHLIKIRQWFLIRGQTL